MNCKPGDMAVVIRSVVPANMGLIVTVVKASISSHSSGLPSWECKPAWPVVMVTTDMRRWPASVELGRIPDAWLRPIRPPETPVTETRDEELAA